MQRLNHLMGAADNRHSSLCLWRCEKQFGSSVHVCVQGWLSGTLVMLVCLTFFHEHESRHCLRLTLSTNSLEVFRCSCLWWKCGEIRTFSSHTFKHRHLIARLQATVFICHTNCIMFVTVETLTFGCRLQALFTLYIQFLMEWLLFSCTDSH